MIVCGLPGAGKTSLARELEASYGAVRFSADEWMVELGVDLFDGPFRDKVEKLQWSVAKRLLQLGQVVVVEWGTWGRDERDLLRESARSYGAAVELRVLDPPLDVLWQRVRTRGREPRLGSRAITRDDLEHWSDQFERPDAEEISLYDPPLKSSGKEARHGNPPP